MKDTGDPVFLCFTAFGMSIWFSIVTPFILLFLSWLRLMAVVNPLSVKAKHIKSTFKCLLAIIFNFNVNSNSINIFDEIYT